MRWLLAAFLTLSAIAIGVVVIAVVQLTPSGSATRLVGALAAGAAMAAAAYVAAAITRRQTALARRLDDVTAERSALMRMMGYQDARLRSLSAQVELLTAVRELSRVSGEETRFDEILLELVRIVTGITGAHEIAIFAAEGDGGPEPAAYSSVSETTLDPQRIGKLVDAALVSACWKEKSVRLRGNEDFLRIASVLLADGERVGVLYLGVPLESEADGREEEAKRLESDVQDMAKHVALALKHTFLARYAVRDRLTNLYNRAQLLKDLSEQLARERQTRSRCCLLMLDIDYFKKVNDTYGHLAGDEVLKEIAKMLSDAVRRGESCYRYGGEEFAVLLPRAGTEDGSILGERIRRKAARLSRNVNGETIRVTLSVGVAQDDDSISGGEELIALADAALYRAKNEGRNRVIVHEPVGSKNA